MRERSHAITTRMAYGTKDHNPARATLRTRNPAYRDAPPSRRIQRGHQNIPAISRRTTIPYIANNAAERVPRNRKIAACPSPTAYLRCWRYTIRAESAGRQRTTASGTKPFRGRSRSTARSKIVSSFPAKASGYPPAPAQTECVKANDRLLATYGAGRTWSRDH